MLYLLYACLAFFVYINIGLLIDDLTGFNDK